MPVQFFNGLSARPQPATLRITNGAVYIEQVNDQGQTITQVWQVADLVAEEFPSSQPRILHKSFSGQALAFGSKEELQAFAAEVGQPALATSRLGFLHIGSWATASRLALIAVVVIAFCVWIVGWGIPWAAEEAAMAVPYEWEESLGESLLTTVTRGSEIESKSASAQAFYHRTGFTSDHDVYIHVLRNDEINAFALPGGHILIYTGLLEKLTRADQLAALMGHELGHVQGRHSMRALMRSVALYGMVSLALGDLSGVAAVLIQNGEILDRLRYSRQLETWSDDFAIAQLKEHHISLGGMVGLFEILQKEGGNETSKFMSTHPLTSDRLAHAKAEARKQGSTQPDAELDRIFNGMGGKSDSETEPETE